MQLYKFLSVLSSISPVRLLRVEIVAVQITKNETVLMVFIYYLLLLLATACFSCIPPNLNFLDPYFIFMYMHNNHCHRVTAHLQSNILLLLLTNKQTVCTLSPCNVSLYAGLI